MDLLFLLYLLVDLMQYLPPLEIIASLVGGGGITAAFVKLKRVFLDSEKQDAEIARELRDELRAELDDHRRRLEDLEAKLDKEREARIRAEETSRILQAKLDLVIRMLNEMREAEGLGPLGEDDILPMRTNP